MSRLAAALGACALLVAHGAAHAAACCMSAASGGVGRLKVWESFAAGTQVAWGSALGEWNRDGRWRAYDGGYAESEVRIDPWVLARLHRRLEMHLLVPFVVTTRRASGESATSGGLGDLAVGARFDLVPPDDSPRSAIALVGGLVVPTGRAMHSARERLGVDATGRGAWALSLGALFERVHAPFFAQLALDALVPLPSWRPDLRVWQRFGPGMEARLGAGVEILADRLVLSGTLRAGVEAPLSLAGEYVPASARLSTGVGALLAYSPGLRWTIVVGIDSFAPALGLGINQPGRLRGVLGLRFGTWG